MPAITDKPMIDFARVIGCCLLFAPWAVAEPASDTPNFQSDVLPVLTSHCGKCHGPETQEAQIRFDQLSTDFLQDRAAAETWQEALHAINAGEMPPEEASPLSAAARQTLTSWITAKLRAAIAAQRSSGGRMVMRRLNNVEYHNTMSDLLGLEMDYARDLPPDGRSPEGFRNNGRSLRMSALQLEYYLDTARRALERVIVTGPPPRAFRHQFERSNVNGWRGPTEMSNRLERAQKFLVRMVDDYPEAGEFRVRVQARAGLKADKGFPLLEVAVGYRPDTEVHFRVAGVREVVSEDTQQFEFRGRLENFPLPVRGQGKYPGLVVRVRNVYDDGTPVPKQLEEIQRGGRTVKAFPAEPHLPHLLIESVEFEGPVYSTWPPPIHRQILFDSPLRDQHELEYLRQVFQRFMSRAYRRPATRREVEEMTAFFASVRPHFTRFEEAVRETLAMVLIQPEFLYLMEPATDQRRQVSDFELAARLSYFLWNTMPDQRLFDLATLGVLHEPSVLRAEVERLLSDTRSQRFVSEFVGQWLRLDRIEQIAVDPQYYPDFQPALKHALRRETNEFFAELLRHDESALQLLQSDFAMLNERLARHYGRTSVFGQAFRRVPLNDPSRRGGLLGHASVLMVNSTGRDSHPVRRAVWIRDRLLGDPPPPPPPDVPELDEADPAFAKLSVREQLELHRSKASCASCHRNIDPWGIALENFDAVGRWREQVRKQQGEHFEFKPVRARDVLPQGVLLDGAAGLRDHLVRNHADDFAHALVSNLLTFAVGRSLELSDEAEVKSLTAEFVGKGYGLRELVHQVVASEAFCSK